MVNCLGQQYGSGLFCHKSAVAKQPIPSGPISISKSQGQKGLSNSVTAEGEDFAKEKAKSAEENPLLRESGAMSV
jgi:hypothetical protein